MKCISSSSSSSLSLSFVCAINIITSMEAIMKASWYKWSASATAAKKICSSIHCFKADEKICRRVSSKCVIIYASLSSSSSPPWTTKTIARSLNVWHQYYIYLHILIKCYKMFTLSSVQRQRQSQRDLTWRKTLIMSAQPRDSYFYCRIYWLEHTTSTTLSLSLSQSLFLCAFGLIHLILFRFVSFHLPNDSMILSFQYIKCVYFGSAVRVITGQTRDLLVYNGIFQLRMSVILGQPGSQFSIRYFRSKQIECRQMTDGI